MLLHLTSGKLNGYMEQKHFYKLTEFQLVSSLQLTYCIQLRATLRQRNLCSTDMLEDMAS
jgi:hypothetical protein